MSEAFVKGVWKFKQRPVEAIVLIRREKRQRAVLGITLTLTEKRQRSVLGIELTLIR